MSAEWPMISLADLYDIRSGLSKPAKDFGSGFPFLSFKDVFYNFFVPDKLTELVQTNERERESCSIKRGDVFLTRTSETINELGMSCVALKDYEQATFNGFTKRLRPKSGMDLLPEYVGYYLRSPSFRREMMAFSTLMSTRASLNNDMIRRLKLLVPPRDLQESIAHILKNLDDKIELNHQINQTLEEMAQAIFKSWFVDFDPVTAKIEAKANGQDPERAAMCAISGKTDAELDQLPPEQLAQLRATAALFPDEFTDSELGAIPNGWIPASLGDLVNFQNGYAFKSKDWVGRGFPVVKIGSVKPGFVDLDSCSYVAEDTVNGLERFILSPGDILVGMTGYPGETGLVPQCGTKVYLNQRVGKFVIEDGNHGVILCAVRNEKFKSFVESQAHGSAQANVSAKAILSFPLINPGPKSIACFEQLTQPVIQKMLLLENEIRTIAELRDTLLPKLLSGEIDLSQVM